ncbi:MAG: YqzL family protein [Clostridia bacterium]|nr:YqzL family protein [Clostridia bacterium]
MKKDFDFDALVDSTWQMFEKTGDISYYLLYKRLTEE